MPTVLIPLPARDFDPSEVAIGWRVLTDHGCTVRFATPDGRPAEADPLMLTGVGLDLWGWLPGVRRVKLLGLALRADANARRAYAELVADPAFRQPLGYADLRREDWDGLYLPGGHWARGMRTYLESPELLLFVGEVFAADKPVAAICHGVLVAARARDASGRSPLHGRRTTCLPKVMERAAYWSTAWLRGSYYRTYPEYVEDEVRAALADPRQFERGPLQLLRRGTRDDDGPAFVVEDGSYVSARWPGDAWLLGKRLVERLSRPSR